VIYDRAILDSRPELQLHLRSNKSLTYEENNEGDNFMYLLSYYEKMTPAEKELQFKKSNNPLGISTWIRNSVGASWGKGDLHRLSRLLKDEVICGLARQLCRTSWARSTFNLSMWDNVLRQKLPVVSHDGEHVQQLLY
jgi:hypothetical protein